MPPRSLLPSLALAGGLALLAACRRAAPSAAPTPPVLRLATTTSTDNTGLLKAILPDFERSFNARVGVVAVGTGQALALGASGDADVVLVHARAKEDQFVADGDGINRLDVMYNDFVLVGPQADPAGVSGLTTAAEAFARIAAARASLVSRGDDSGTHSKEQSIWKAAGLVPGPGDPWYSAIGQGMGATLVFANEKLAYTLSDRGTWLAQKASLPNLRILVGGGTIAENKDPGLLNPYGVIEINPQKHPGVNNALAHQFAQWLTSVATQQLIADFGKDQFGQPLFYPDSAPWHAAHP
ncbi:MAG: substrate-binding domain-containing protein [Chloroflexi bacterium]|nr:substrate-binding domain-containing protein [Chloroflexota bacterium]